MICSKCGFQMEGKPIDQAITIWRCPLGHKKTEIINRPSAVHTPRGTYPNTLETT